MSRYRSLLFAPGNHPRRVEKAMSLEADVVILDLEDACPITEKIATRPFVVEALQRPRRARGYVRVNALSTEFGFSDLCAVIRRGVDGVVLTKVDGPDEIRTADWLMTQIEREQMLCTGSVDLIPLIETAAGVARAEAIASASPRVKRLAFGAGDFTADVGVRWSRDELELLSFRSALVLASRTARIEPPIDLAWLDTKDAEGLCNSIEWGRRLGFQGKLCIHPDHVDRINVTFTPSAEEVARATRVVEAFRDAERSGSAAFVLDGAMIDYAVVLQARRVIERAGSSAPAQQH